MFYHVKVSGIIGIIGILGILGIIGIIGILGMSDTVARICQALHFSWHSLASPFDSLDTRKIDTIIA